MSRNPSLHVVGCIAAPKHKAEQTNLQKFLIAQSHSFDDESDDVEDEAKELRNENYTRVNSMIQEAKKEVNHRRNPENKMRNSFSKRDDTGCCETDTLDVLRKMERLRSEKDQRSSVREEKADQVTVCKKQDSNVEYFTGKKRSKNKVKQKKQEKTINLTDLDRTHRQQQQLTADVSAPRIVSCWEQKKGSELFESKQQCLSVYNCPGTEQEVLELAIAESIKTHKAEMERNSYTTHSFIPDVKAFPEDDWDTGNNKTDVMGYHQPEFYGIKNNKIKHTPDCQSACGDEKKSLYLNEVSAMKSGLEIRTTDLKTVYFNEEPPGSATWDEWEHHDSVDNEKTLIDGLNDVDKMSLFDSNEETDDNDVSCSVLDNIPHKPNMNLELKYRPRNEEVKSIDGEHWDKSVGSTRAVLNKVQSKSEMDLELKYRPTRMRDPPRKSKINEALPITREHWVSSDKRHDTELKKMLHEDYIQPSEPDYGFVREIHVKNKTFPKKADHVETSSLNEDQNRGLPEGKQEAKCLPIEQFFNFENVPVSESEIPASSTHIQRNKNLPDCSRAPGNAVNPDVYAMLQTLHQSINMNPAARNPEDVSIQRAMQGTTNIPPPQNEDLARLMTYMHIQENRNTSTTPQVLGMPFQVSERGTSPVSAASEAQQQSMLNINYANRNVAEAGEMLPTNPSVVQALEARRQSLLNMNPVSHVSANPETPNPQREEEEVLRMHPDVVAAHQRLMLNGLLQMQARQLAMGYPWLCNNIMLPNPLLNPFVLPFPNPMLGMVPGAVPVPPNTAAMMNYGNGQNTIPSRAQSGTAGGLQAMSGLTTEALTGKGRGRIIM